jgi:hypothetical protein
MRESSFAEGRDTALFFLDRECYIFYISDRIALPHAGGWSNGKAADSDSAYQGSSPCPPATQIQAPGAQQLLVLFAFMAPYPPPVPHFSFLSSHLQNNETVGGQQLEKRFFLSFRALARNLVLHRRRFLPKVEMTWRKGLNGREGRRDLTGRRSFFNRFYRQIRCRYFSGYTSLIAFRHW